MLGRKKDEANPHTQALKELEEMPMLAGRLPRSAFNERTVVMQDLQRTRKTNKEEHVENIRF